MLDLEDPAYKGKSMAEVQKEIWDKDVAALKKLGVNLADDHMDGYLWKGERVEENLDVKPWEADVFASIPEPKGPSPSYENWNNPEVLFEIADGVAYLTLNRPDANNAINAGIDGGLADACRILRGRSDVRVVVLTGAGRMFCAGGDPKSFQSFQGVGGGAQRSGPPAGPEITGVAKAMAGNTTSANTFAKLLYQFASLPQFTICCAQGSAMGGGVGFLCCCDMAIAVKSAHIVLSEVKLGVIPATISPHVIAKMGTTRAKRFFCTAENFKAADAMEMGLIQHVVDNPQGFAPLIEEVVKKIQVVAPGAMKASKAMMTKVMNARMSNSLIKYMATEYAQIRKGAEAESGMKAVGEKKKPEWMDATITLKQ